MIGFIIQSTLLGVGLAMDAFSVSMANGLNEPNMKRPRMLLMAFTYCFFQIIMPIIGWVCVHTIATYFTLFQKAVPWIALILLLYIGGKMLIEGIKDDDEGDNNKVVGFGDIMIQGIATSIDALSVGFAIESYSSIKAIGASLIIGVVTFLICIAGLIIGKTFGNKLAGKATILGGIILIGIGIKICFFS